MNRVAGRSTIALLLAGVLLGGMLLFFGEFLFSANEWVHFQGSPHVYTGGNIGCGTVLDRSGVLLLSSKSERVYSEDLALRMATIHWLGDREGYISAPAVSHYSQEIAGYSLINGMYSYGGVGGEATLTLSAQAQKAALDAMGGRKGTVAVYNYSTGEILCAVTTPNYDPDNKPDISGDETGAYEGVYLNRFTQVSYVPGSIFKIVTVAAALEEMGQGAAEQIFDCPGSYKIGSDYVTCGKAHGKISLKTALAKSCNCYFAQLVQKLGGSTLKRYVDKFGVTDPVSFDGITTRAGSFDLEGAASVEIAWSGIGQYEDLVNPDRFMTFMGVIAGGGEAAQPFVVNRVRSDGRTSYLAERISTGRLMERATCQTLRELMRNNVTTIYGDNWFPGLEVCAKSGTAEVGGGELPNATFAGFVANEEYPLAFVCVVENGGAGSDTCVPIVSEVLLACKNVLDSE